MQTYLHPHSELISSAELGEPNGISELVVRLLGSVQGSLIRSYQKVLVGTMSFPDSMSFEILRREFWVGSA